MSNNIVVSRRLNQQIYANLTRTRRVGDLNVDDDLLLPPVSIYCRVAL